MADGRRVAPCLLLPLTANPIAVHRRSTPAPSLCASHRKSGRHCAAFTAMCATRSFGFKSPKSTHTEIFPPCGDMTQVIFYKAFPIIQSPTLHDRDIP